MIGMMYDFEAADIRFDGFGAIEKAVIDNQNCALIATSEVCRITRPEVGAYLFARVINRQAKDVKQLVADARRMVEADGGKQVYLTPVLDDHGRVANVTFKADYGEPYVLVDNSVVLTYILDYATPEVIRKRYEKGTVVTLQSPDDLGFVLPSTHAFQSWTYLGQDVTQVTVPEGGMIIEGRIERQPGANLIRDSRYLTNVNVSNSSSSLQVTRGSRPGEFHTGVSRVSDDGFFTLVRSTMQPNAQYNGTLYTGSLPYIGKTLTAGSVLVFSALVQRSNYPTISGSWQLNPSTSAASGIGRVIAYLVDGISSSGRISDLDSHLVEVVFELLQDVPANSLLTLGGPALRFPIMFNSTAGVGYIFTIDMWLPKLEDVTGLPEEEQRATAWVPHVDDAI